MIFDYEEFVTRNVDIISEKAQQKIKETRLLIAGCGIGSQFAETALRLGYSNITLLDGDTVSTTNLNRQNFDEKSIGNFKAAELAKRLESIWNKANIKAISENLTEKNVEGIVAEHDLIFDTIDFLDLSAIVALHDQCQIQNKPIVTAMSAGFGGAAMYFPPNNKTSFREIFGLPLTGDITNVSYASAFAKVIRNFAKNLDPEVYQHTIKVIKLMEDKQPCPASQVAVGSACVSALAGTIAVRIAEGLHVTSVPEMIVLKMHQLIASSGIKLVPMKNN